MPLQFKASSIGYFSIETEPIITSEVDEISIEVNFAEDDRPMVHHKSEIYMEEMSSFNLEEHKSISKGTYLDLSFYHSDDKTQLIPAVFIVNGLLFGPKDGPYHIIYYTNQPRSIHYQGYICCESSKSIRCKCYKE